MAWNVKADNLFEVTTEELKLFHKRKHERLSPELTKAFFLRIRLENTLRKLEGTDE
ncbi:hypothetical protein [Streptococcus suis]|uniref:hypothetical protein n=1 Tax=Streptococcus suis TaxID=1307 RepID=UPI00137534E2|nr:hypothetical protein [Streptococcus suis]